jgi:hypothetical protein
MRRMMSNASVDDGIPTHLVRVDTGGCQRTNSMEIVLSMGDGWSGTIEDWLNNHKMIAGQYGTLDVGYCEDAIFGEDGDNLIKYELTNGDDSITMSVYPRLAIVRCVSTQGNNFLNLSDARNVWDSLIQTGYRKVVRHEETV